jgi:quercetin dioxygenase-like cupin family protein
MSTPKARSRPHPSDRFSGEEHALDLAASIRALRKEPVPASSGHRQIALMHRGPVRLVLFAFDAGGALPQHSAPGWVTIHVLRGSLEIQTPDGRHVLGDHQLLTLAPDVPHDVIAKAESDMLLGIYPEAPVGSQTRPPTG